MGVSLSANPPQPNQTDFFIEDRWGVQRSQVGNDSLSAFLNDSGRERRFTSCSNIKVLISSGLADRLRGC